MKKLLLALILCLTVAVAYGEGLSDIMSGIQDKVTNVVKETTNTVVDDSLITTGVKTKLSTTASLKGSKIDVSTSDGVVTLTGTVKTAKAKDKATQIATAVKGVKSVDNQLTVE